MLLLLLFDNSINAWIPDLSHLSMHLQANCKHQETRNKILEVNMKASLESSRVMVAVFYTHECMTFHCRSLLMHHGKQDMLRNGTRWPWKISLIKSAGQSICGCLKSSFKKSFPLIFCILSWIVVLLSNGKYKKYNI